MGKIAALAHLRKCAEGSRAFVLGLVGNVAGTVAEALEEMDRMKADRSGAEKVTIPAGGWKSDSTAGYPEYYDIAAAGVTAKDRAEITIAYSSLDTARACGLCPTNETLEGKIRIRAAGVPAADITAEYWITDGKE